MLPVHYHQDRESDEQPPEAAMSLFKDLDVAYLLNDPVFGRSSCAAVACSKIMSFLRQNSPNLTEVDETRRRNRKNRASCERTISFLNLVQQYTQEALSEGCNPERVSELLHQIVDFASEATEEEEKDDRQTETQAKNTPRRFSRPCRKFASVHQKHSTPLLPIVSSMFRIPFSGKAVPAVAEFLGLGDSAEADVTEVLNPANVGDLQHLATAVDPFLITMAGNRLNSDYLGNGCVRVSKSASSPTMIWAPPIRRRDAIKTNPCIYVAPLPPSSADIPLTVNKFAAIELPEEFLGSSICELDAVQVRHF